MEFLKKNIILLLIICSVIGYSQDNISNAFKESYSLEKAGDYSKAIEKIKSVYSENSYEINLRLGWLNYYAGFFTESTSYYNKSISLMPYSIEAKFGLINAAAALGNWNVVIKSYDDILKIDPSNYTANYRLGAIYYGRQEYSKAFKYFELIANNFPFDYDANHMFAWTSYRIGKTREAKILFEKVLLISPDDESAKEGLSLVK